MQVNCCKKKAMTNIRAASKDATTVISEAIPVNLDYALEVRWDEGWWAERGQGHAVRNDLTPRCLHPF